MWTEPQSPNPQRLLNLSVGLASPLWPTFYAAATTGMAWWWMAGYASRLAVAPAMLGASAPTAQPDAIQVPKPIEIIADLQFDPEPDVEDLENEASAEAVIPAILAPVKPPAPRKPRKPAPSGARPRRPKSI